MCIRDGCLAAGNRPRRQDFGEDDLLTNIRWEEDLSVPVVACLLYTSDAADERSSVDLGGRRTIKKKKTQ